MLMLDFVYNCLWKTYSPATAQILYTDTDSLYIKVTGLTPTPNKTKKYQDFLTRFSPDMHTLHFAGNGDLTVGKMKLEKLIDEAIFLKPKTYALRCSDDANATADEECHNKGVKAYQNQEQHRFQAYHDVLFQHSIRHCVNTNIRRTDKFTTGLQMNTLQVTKVGLDAWEDKRRWVDRLHSEPYGLGNTPSRVRPLTDRMMDNLYQRAKLSDFTGTKAHYEETGLGCSAKQLLEHVTGQFKVGMCHQNYGVSPHGWALDHIIPVSFIHKDEFKRLDTHQQECIRKHIWHYTNLQPLSLTDNSSKKDTISPSVRAKIDTILQQR